MESYGQRLQYSVFLCDLSGTELLAWRSDILDVIETFADSVVKIDLGETGSAATVEAIGTSRRLPSAGPTIV